MQDSPSTAASLDLENRRIENLDRIRQAATAAAKSQQPEERVQHIYRGRARSDGRNTAISVVALSALFVILTALNLTGLSPLLDRGRPPSGEERTRILEEDLEHGVLEIEAYRAELGELPESLADLGFSSQDQGWRYEVVDREHYRVTLTSADYVGTYDSAVTSAARFAELGQEESP